MVALRSFALNSISTARSDLNRENLVVREALLSAGF